MKIYVTFGQVHTHSVNGKTLDKDCVAVINCGSAEQGRKIAIDLFGDKFFTTHIDKEKMDRDVANYYPRGYIEINSITQQISEEGPLVSKVGLLDMQVCVPSDYTDNQVIEFAEKGNSCGTTGGWQIRRQGSINLAGCEERVPCQDRDNYVHIMLDA